MDTFNVIVLGNSVTRWLFAFAVIVVVYALLRIGKGFIGRQLSALARKSVYWTPAFRSCQEIEDHLG
jgi:hypothetical protein